jgi:hypothetical protein
MAAQNIAKTAKEFHSPHRHHTPTVIQILIYVGV